MSEILVPIFVCVVLPVAIVLIVFLTDMNKDKQRTKIIIKAIESGNIDTDKLVEALGDRRKPRRTPGERLTRRLLRGCIFSLIGIVIIVTDLLGCFGEGGFMGEGISSMMLGGVSLAVGVSFLIVYFVTKKQLPEEVRNEREQCK